MGWDRSKAEGPWAARAGHPTFPAKAQRHTSQKRSWSPRAVFKYALCSGLWSSSRKKKIWLRPEDQDECLIILEATWITISLWDKAALSCLCPNNFLQHHTVSACLWRSWFSKVVVRTVGMDLFLNQFYKRLRDWGQVHPCWNS